MARDLTAGEEIVNAVTHGLGLMASLAAFPMLVTMAGRHGDGWTVGGVAVFGLTLIALYFTSTVYHALPLGHAKRLWWRLDHAAIYLLIAGTYTPFTLGPLRGPWGWTLFGIVWTVAGVGAYSKIRVGPRSMMLSTIVYLALGWLAVFALRPLGQQVGAGAVTWLLAGGIAYTLGVAFFACDERMKGAHCVWHLFVLGGSLCHVMAVAAYSGATT